MPGRDFPPPHFGPPGAHPHHPHGAPPFYPPHDPRFPPPMPYGVPYPPHMPPQHHPHAPLPYPQHFRPGPPGHFPPPRFPPGAPQGELIASGGKNAQSDAMDVQVPKSEAPQVEALPKDYRLNLHVGPLSAQPPREPKYFTAAAAMKQLPIVEALLTPELLEKVKELRGDAELDKMDLDEEKERETPFAVDPEIDFLAKLEQRTPAIERVLLPKFSSAAPAAISVGPSDPSS